MGSGSNWSGDLNGPVNEARGWPKAPVIIFRLVDKRLSCKHFFESMKLIFAAFIILLALMTSAQCQQTATDWYNRGVDLYGQSKYDDAIKAYDEAIKINPKLYRSLVTTKEFLSLRLRVNTTKPSKAYDEAIWLDPKLTEAWSNKGNALFIQGKYDEAIKASDEAIRLDPNLATPWYNKGNALFIQGKYDEAIKAFR